MLILDTLSIASSVCGTDHFEQKEFGMKAKHRLDYAYHVKVFNLFVIC